MEKIYPKGINIFPPHQSAPEFVKGRVSVDPKRFLEWLKEHAEYRNEKGYFSFDLLDGREGLYLTLDTWKPEKKDTGSEEAGAGYF